MLYFLSYRNTLVFVVRIERLRFLEGIVYTPDMSSIAESISGFTPSAFLGDREKMRMKSQLKVIQQYASIISANVRKYGKCPSGPMWAQGYTLLPDGRIVFLQQAQTETGIPDTLEVRMQPYPDGYDTYSTHVRYDLSRNQINTFELRSPQCGPMFQY